MKLQVHTLRFGNPDWMQMCVPTLEAWCERHGHDLRVHGDPGDAYPTPKLVEIDAIGEFLKSDADCFAWIDADVYVHPEAPAAPTFEGIAMATDCYHGEHQAHWGNWCDEHFKERPDFQYSNAGVYFLDRKAAAILHKQMVPPFIVEFQEQHQMCWWVTRAIKAGAKFTRLLIEWNRFAADYEPAWMRHAWGPNKVRDLEEMRESGMLHKAPDGLRYSFHPGHTPYQDKVVYLQFVKNCGLGNQAFEAAAGLNICRKLGVPVRMQYLETGYREFGLKAFGLGVLPFRSVPLVSDRVGQGHPKLITHCLHAITRSPHRVVAVSHPFQSEECFIGVADEIREIFKLDPFPLNVPQGKTPVGMQVRRGDYIGHPRLNVVTPHYFNNAMEWMRAEVERPHFFVVSDDPEWCRRQFEHRLDVTVMPPQEAIDGLRTLAACKAHIISNSTFGWWGAWLGESGPVVVPEIWHHKPGSYGDWKPVPERWHRISINPLGQPLVVEPVKARMVVEQPAPSLKRAIVYPWHADQAKWHELRYSLRSIWKHFADKDCPVFIMGTRRPDWLIENSRVKYLGAWSYQDALSKGLQVAETVMWMNDDIVLLKDVGWPEVSVPRYVRPIDAEAAVAAPAQSNPWREGCRKVLSQLVAEGVTDLKLYSTHTPYVYDREKVLKVFERFGAWEKMPLELAYFSMHGDGATEIGEDRVHELPLDGATYLNYTDRHLTPELKDELRRRFPDFAPWELQMAFQG